eukprot:gene5651-7804_t
MKGNDISNSSFIHQQSNSNVQRIPFHYENSNRGIEGYQYLAVRKQIKENQPIAEESRSETSFFNKMLRSLIDITARFYGSCINDWRISTQNLTLSNLIGVYFMIFIFIMATSVERISFKLTIDKMLPYKFVLVQLIFLISCIIFSIISFYHRFITQEITSQMTEFPHSKLITMAFIDSIQFIWAVYTASFVSPTMTLILMHTSMPFVVIVSKHFFPSREYTITHINGLKLIVISIVIGLVGSSLFSDYNNQSRFQILYFGALYSLSYAMHGCLSLYKEDVIIKWGQPISIYYLSSWLYFYQFLCTIGFSLFHEFIRGVLGYQHLTEIFLSIHDGWRCFLGENDLEDQNKYYNYVNCFDSVWLIFAYVFSNVLIVLTVNSVLQTGNFFFVRSIGLAVFFSFVSLWIYDESSSVSIFDIISIVFLLVGLELYNKENEPDFEIITHFSPTSTNSTSQGIKL